MLFKRPIQGYGKTPEPVTPYEKAAQLWDERIGSSRVQARNWRFMALGCLTLAAGFATDRAALFLNEYAKANDPSGQIGTRSVSVQVTSVVRASDSSFQVKWAGF